MPLPWLDQPIMLEGMRMSMCDQTPEECDYKQQRFRNWYLADYVYAQGTVFFFVAAIGACMAVYVASYAVPNFMTKTTLWRKGEAALRFLAYRSGKVGSYRTTSLGVGLLITLGAIFFTVMTLGPQPYYWPDINWGNSPPIATRSGWMSLACLPFMLALSTKANMIAAVTGVSHEKLIVFHKWTGWAMFVLALIHTFPFLVVDFQNGIMEEQWTGSIFYWSGVVALLAQAYLQFFSLSFIRKRFYEIFKATHLLMALVFVLFLFFHCDFTLTSAYYFIATGVLYFLSIAYSSVRTYFEHGLSLRARLDLVCPGTLRITIPVRRNTTWRPGQHMFLCFPGGGNKLIHGLSYHPFTICSVPATTAAAVEDGRKQQEMGAGGELVFYVAERGGLTAHLTKLASGAGDQRAMSIPVRIDGAYGGVKSRPLELYDRTLIIACGAGAAFSLGFVMESMLVATKRNATSDQATEVKGAQLEVVIATRQAETVSWYTDALARFVEENGLYEASGGSIQVSIYQTQAHSSSLTSEDVEPKAGITAESQSVSSRLSFPASARLQIKIGKGRPNIGNIVRDSAKRHPGGSLAILACGPGSVLQDVQSVAAEVQLDILTGKRDQAGEVYLHTEHFSDILIKILGKLPTLPLNREQTFERCRRMGYPSISTTIVDRTSSRI